MSASPVLDATPASRAQPAAPASQLAAAAGLRILLLAPYTGGNLGDGAIQDAAIHHLRKRLVEPRISLVTLNPRATAKLHGLPSYPIERTVLDAEPPARPSSGEAAATSPAQAIDDPSPAEPAAANRSSGLAGMKKRLQRVSWLYRVAAKARNGLRKGVSIPVQIRREVGHVLQAHRLLKQTDVLVMSGGGQIDDYWGGPFGHPYALLKWASLARMRKVPVLFLSVGVCFLESRMSRRFACQALRLAAYRSYRDAGSKELLREAAFTRHDPVYPDLAFSHPCVHEPAGTYAGTPGGPFVVGISPIVYLSPHGWPQRDLSIYQRYIKALSEFTVKLLEAGHEVVLFTSCAMDQSAVNDLRASLDQAAAGKGWQTRLRQVNQHCLDSQLAEMRKLDLVVASRLHGIILSHLLGKPTLAISYDRKVRVHMEAMAQQRFCVDHRDFNAAQLGSCFAELGLEPAANSQRIRARVQECSHALDEQYDAVVRMVCHRS